MKIKSLVLLLALGLGQTALASNNIHSHPSVQANPATAAAKKAMMPGYCEIEIINDSNAPILVGGRFDDGSYLPQFSMYPHEIPQYITLYYGNYCHAGMDIYISNAISGAPIYSGYTYTGATVRIVPYLQNQVTAKVSTK